MGKEGHAILFESLEASTWFSKLSISLIKMIDCVV
jgi:hypothetical protein